MAVGMKGGARMDFVVRGRGSRVSSQSRERVERKLARLARLNSGIQRIEVELIEEPNRRVNGGHRVEVACWTARRTFRASSTGSDIDAALDRVTERLERQLTDEHDRRRTRRVGGANRLKSGEKAVSREEDVPPAPES
jgi:ribosomal subunit interface protein